MEHNPSDSQGDSQGEMQAFFDFTVDQEGAMQPNAATQLLRSRTPVSGIECVGYSVMDPHDPDKEVVQKKIMGQSPWASAAEDRAVGAFLGMPIGDAIGAPVEFQAVVYHTKTIDGMGTTEPQGSFALRPGQWTDDAAMGLCLADSLLVNEGFNGVDLKLRFTNWWSFGYNNAFRFDEKRFSRRSVGLGGNISMSIFEFIRNGKAFTSAGDKDTSGNGSIMRLAAVPLYYHNDVEKGMEIAGLQSLTTHQGEEAAECCRLMTHLIIKAMKEGDGTPAAVLTSIEFKSNLKSINCLVNSQQETATEGKKWDLADRNWNWKDKNHRYSPLRSKQQPGYVGSYAMDALAMALHCVWTTTNFKDAILKAANMRGDADTVAAVTGQIAGSIYGASSIPKEWISTIQKWDNHGEIALRASKLFHHTPLKKQTP